MNSDPEASATDNWLVKGKRLVDLQDICELVVVTLTGPGLILSRGRDGLDPSKEEMRLVEWWPRRE